MQLNPTPSKAFITKNNFPVCGVLMLSRWIVSDLTDEDIAHCKEYARKGDSTWTAGYGTLLFITHEEEGGYDKFLTRMRARKDTTIVEYKNPVHYNRKTFNIYISVE